MGGPGTMISPNFYPRSPCGERRSEGTTATSRATFLSTLSLRRATVFVRCAAAGKIFLSTLSLRRATVSLHDLIKHFFISIHALLAESDGRCQIPSHRRSISIHALLAESDPQIKMMGAPVDNFYPRSPCGERRTEPLSMCTRRRFLSTLSLRRATPAPTPIL